MKRGRSFLNFVTETMAQPLYKIPIWWFVFIAWKGLFYTPNITILPVSYFWRKSYVNPFTKNPLWPLCKNDVFMASRGLFSHRIMYMYITKHDFKAYFVKKWRMRKFSFFFFFTKITSSQNSDLATLQRRFIAWRKLYYIKNKISIIDL